MQILQKSGKTIRNHHGTDLRIHDTARFFSRDSASTETLGDLSHHGSASHLELRSRHPGDPHHGYPGYPQKKDSRLETLESANSEIEQLNKTVEKLRGELQGMLDEHFDRILGQ